MSKLTGVPAQLLELVSVTDNALRYKPGAPPQSIVIEFEPCPVCKTPPPLVIVH